MKRLIAAAGPLRPLLESRGFAELVRYGIGGLGVTLCATLIYSGLAGGFRIHPLLANTVSCVAGLVIGYTVHSRWSFRADPRAGEGAMIVRFLIASGLAFALNSLWVWLLAVELRLPPLAPVPMMMAVTPLISFFVNRRWVFRTA